MDADFPLDGSLFGEGQPCFGCGPDHPAGFRLRFERAQGGVLTRFTPTQAHQGPLGLMHGGLVATLADEAAAWAVLEATRLFGFTTSFQVRLSRGVRVGREVEVLARVHKATHRVVKAGVELRQEGEVCFTGDFTFVLVDEGQASRMLGAPVPEAWKRFCRQG